jgi:integrase
MTSDSTSISSISSISSIGSAFGALVDHTLALVSPSSARVYAQTYRKWAEWAAGAALDPFAFTPANALAFLKAQNITKATQSRQLSAMRRLAAMAAALYGGEFERLERALRMVKAPGVNAAGESAGHERAGRALAAHEVYALLNVWRSGRAGVRNHALIALLVYTGMRRAEAAALQWGDIDFEAGIVRIRHGKGDKARAAAILGAAALDALKDLKAAQPQGYQHVFTPFRRGGAWAHDVPISGTDVYRIVVETARRAGVDFKPHDLRRTLITSALRAGSSLADVQLQAGHARGETTLRYAKAVDVEELHQRINLSFGR